MNLKLSKAMELEQWKNQKKKKIISNWICFYPLPIQTLRITITVWKFSLFYFHFFFSLCYFASLHSQELVKVNSYNRRKKKANNSFFFFNIFFYFHFAYFPLSFFFFLLTLWVKNKKEKHFFFVLFTIWCDRSKWENAIKSKVVVFYLKNKKL